MLGKVLNSELVYSAEEYQQAAQVILRTHDSIRQHYTMVQVVQVLTVTHGTLSLTVHALCAALEMRRWHKDILSLAMFLARECYNHIRWGSYDPNRP